MTEEINITNNQENPRRKFSKNIFSLSIMEIKLQLPVQLRKNLVIQ